MRTKLVSMMVAVLCLMAGTAWGYVIDPLIGIEYIQIRFGDVEGVWGSAKWLKAQDLLPIKADGKKMSVAEGYVKMCLENFAAENLRATLKKCEEASLHLQPGQTLKLFAPVLAREAYNARVIMPLRAEMATKDKQIAELKRQNGYLQAKFSNASAELAKSAAVILSMKVARDHALRRAEELGETVSRNQAALEKILAINTVRPNDFEWLYESPMRYLDYGVNTRMLLISAFIAVIAVGLGAMRSEAQIAPLRVENRLNFIKLEGELKTVKMDRDFWKLGVEVRRSNGATYYRKGAEMVNGKPRFVVICGCGDEVFLHNLDEHLQLACSLREIKIKRPGEALAIH